MRTAPTGLLEHLCRRCNAVHSGALRWAPWVGRRTVVTPALKPRARLPLERSLYETARSETLSYA